MSEAFKKDDNGEYPRCKCMFNQTCHLPRQQVRIKAREDGLEKDVSDCWFYIHMLND